MLRRFSIISAIAIIATGCGSALADSAATEPPPQANAVAVSSTHAPLAGPVLIEAGPVVSGNQVVGKFLVFEGSDVLGCSSGDFADTPDASGILRILNCRSGSRTGTIVLRLVGGNDSGPFDLYAPWTIEHGTGEFVGVSGGGVFSLLASDETGVGRETFRGEILFGPADVAQYTDPSDPSVATPFPAAVQGGAHLNSAIREAPEAPIWPRFAGPAQYDSMIG